MDRSNFQVNLGFLAPSWVTKWTSISPDSRVVLEAIDSPCSNLFQRPLLVTPKTIWVAFTLRAKSKTPVAISSDEISWNDPPRDRTNFSIRASSVTSLTVMPSLLRMWTANNLAPGVLAEILAARLMMVSASGESLIATTIFSWDSQISLIPSSLRYFCNPSSTLSATQSSANSRNADRLPMRK